MKQVCGCIQKPKKVYRSIIPKHKTILVSFQATFKITIFQKGILNKYSVSVQTQPNECGNSPAKRNKVEYLSAQ